MYLVMYELWSRALMCILKSVKWIIRGKFCPLLLFPFLGPLEKLRKAAISFIMSLRPHGTTRLLLDRFSLNLIFEDFLKIFQENASFIKIRQEWRVLYVRRPIHILIICCSFLLRMRNVKDKCRVNQNTHLMFSNSSSEIAPFMRKCGKIL
jgi:hypothetical protein